MGKTIGECTAVVAEGRAAIGGMPEVGEIYRNVEAINGFPEIPGVTTLYEMFENSAKLYSGRKALGWRPGPTEDFQWLTYQQVKETVTNLANAMTAAGFPTGGRCGIFGPNCPEWMLTLQALNRISGKCVPLYDTLGETAVEYVVKHADVQLISVASGKLKDLAKIINNVTSTVLTVVYWGEADKEVLKLIEDAGVAVHQFDEFVEAGKKAGSALVAPKPTDPACIMYTSGTTGNPKGVLLTHQNIVSCVAGIHKFLEIIGERVTESDALLSYLTLAHSFGRVVEEAVLSVGGRIGYWQGDVKKLLDDMKLLKPTLFVSVPRILDRIYTEVTGVLATRPQLVQYAFNWLLQNKIRQMNKTGDCSQSACLLEPLFFDKLKQGFGGNIRFIVSGGAPLARHCQEFLQATLGSPVIQGYGLTETCAASFLATGAAYLGTVGAPMAGTEFRLESVPEMNYSARDSPPRGEVCIRGPQVFSGYYKDEKQTKEAFDADGFFHTGDIAEVTDNGALKIIDRKKNIFKLAQGEYVAAEFLEQVLSGADVVDMMWVYGNSFETSLVAVVIPNKKIMQKWVEANMPGTSYADVLNTEQARAYVLKELSQVGKAAKLRGFEMVRAVVLEEHEWAMAGDFLTPSLKLKRPALLKHYQQQIDAMYELVKAQQAARK